MHKISKIKTKHKASTEAFVFFDTFTSIRIIDNDKIISETKNKDDISLLEYKNYSNVKEEIDKCLELYDEIEDFILIIFKNLINQYSFIILLLDDSNKHILNSDIYVSNNCIKNTYNENIWLNSILNMGFLEKSILPLTVEIIDIKEDMDSLTFCIPIKSRHNIFLYKKNDIFIGEIFEIERHMLFPMKQKFIHIPMEFNLFENYNSFISEIKRIIELFRKITGIINLKICAKFKYSKDDAILGSIGICEYVPEIENDLKEQEEDNENYGF